MLKTLERSVSRTPSSRMPETRTLRISTAQPSPTSVSADSLEASAHDDALDVLDLLLRELFNRAQQADRKARLRSLKDLDELPSLWPLPAGCCSIPICLTSSCVSASTRRLDTTNWLRQDEIHRSCRQALHHLDAITMHGTVALDVKGGSHRARPSCWLLCCGFSLRMLTRPSIGRAVSWRLKPSPSLCGQAAPTLVQ